MKKIFMFLVLFAFSIAYTSATVVAVDVGNNKFVTTSDCIIKNTTSVSGTETIVLVSHNLIMENAVFIYPGTSAVILNKINDDKVNDTSPVRGFYFIHCSNQNYLTRRGNATHLLTHTLFERNRILSKGNGLASQINIKTFFQ